MVSILLDLFSGDSLRIARGLSFFSSKGILL